MRKFAAFILGLALLLAGSCTRTVLKTDLSLDSSERHWAQNTLKKLTLEEKIGQMIGLRYTGRFLNRDSEGLSDLKRWVVEYHLGGLILTQGDVYETAILTNTLQNEAKIPLLIAADLERGLGNQLDGATLFPPFMSIGATGSSDLAYAMGKITALEARAVGLHMTYAPVVDVNNNPDNPIINVRSFGEDPKEVARLGIAFIRGCQDNGLIATAKHFPGHGDTDLDSHSELPVIPGDRERLDRIELYPFKKAIEAGVMAIMSAHLQVPALDPTPHLPATLSRPILTDLLRNEYGYRGLIVTDAMEMGGIAALYPPEEAALKAILAGADMLLLPLETEDVILFLVKSVKSGDLSESRIDASVRRILQVKARLGLHKTRSVNTEELDTVVASARNRALAQLAFEKSLTLVKNEKDVLPVPEQGKKIAVLSLSSDPGGYFAGRPFVSALKKRNPEISEFYAEASTGKEYFPGALLLAQKADVVIVALYSRLSAWKGSVDLNPRHIELIQELARGSVPVVVISFNSPYFLKHFPHIDAYICAYRHADLSQEAVVRALFGEIGLDGRLPVSIPDLYPAGHGLILLPLEK